MVASYHPQQLLSLTMGLSVSRMPPKPWFVPADTLEEMESWLIESYDDRTSRILGGLRRTRAKEAHPTLALVPDGHRDAFNAALDFISTECEHDYRMSEWWLHRMWDIVEWSTQDEKRVISRTTIGNFYVLVDLRDSRRNGQPWAVAQECVLVMRILIRDPHFGLSEWMIHSFGDWLRCRNVPDMPPDFTYIESPFQWAPTEYPQNPIEVAISNLARRPIETLIEPEEVAECGTCRVEVEAGTEVTVLEPFCSHWFHTGCIHYVFRQGSGYQLCPVCRANITLQ